MQPQLLDAADQALARGDGVTAERLLRSLIDLCGDQVLLRAKLGRSLLLQEAFIEAEAVLLPSPSNRPSPSGLTRNLVTRSGANASCGRQLSGTNKPWPRVVPATRRRWPTI